MFGCLGSQSGGTYRTLGLNRTLLKEVYRRLNHTRHLQRVFPDVICATRFSTIGANGTLPLVICPSRCGNPDSLLHMTQCYGVALPQRPLGGDSSATSPVELSSRGESVGTNIPLPSYPPLGDAISPSDEKSIRQSSSTALQVVESQERAKSTPRQRRGKRSTKVSSQISESCFLVI